MRTEPLQGAIQYYASAQDLPEAERQLFEAARRAVESAYAPYSSFYVGAAVLLENGAIVSGANQENASYGLSMCAERTTLFAAQNQHPNVPIRAIAITGKSSKWDEKTLRPMSPLMPCGACRQCIKEYEDRAKRPIVIVTGAWKGDIARIEGIATLLPMGFGPADFA
jgi:cytidine deaminase